MVCFLLAVFANRGYTVVCNNDLTFFFHTGADYIITVTSINKGVAGDGVSIPITAQPNPPILVEDSSTVDSVSVRWPHPGGDVDYYLVDCDKGTPENDNIPAIIGELIATCNVATPGNNYTVYVTSVSNGQLSNQSGQSVTANPEIVKNLRDKDDGEVVTSYVEVEWEKPNGTIDGYVMNCSQGEPQQSLLDKTATSGICDKVVAGANIIVTVWSVSGLKVSRVDSTIVTAYPNIVANLSSLPSTSSSVSVEWDKPYGELTRYLVNCSDGVPSAPSIDDNGEENLNVDCIDVMAGSSVKVTVTTESGTKLNPTSISVESAPGAVVDLTEDNATTDSVTVSWKLPEDQKPTYQYVVESSDNNATCNTTESNTAATCAPVTAGSLITVTVTTVSGKLNSSDDINVRAIPNEVSDVTIGEPTTDSVSVSWKRPMGELNSYEITCSSGVANPDILPANNGSVLSASCSGDDVTAGLTVTVNITTVSGLKGGNPFFINATAKPNPAANLTEESVTTDSVTASWEDPAGEVTEYNVSCSSGVASPSTVPARNYDTSYEASCINLSTPGDDYTITVTSISEGVAGESVSINITAQPNAPQLVEDSSTVDSVSVRWPHPGGVVDYYLVDCDEGTPEKDTITAIEGELIATCNVTTPGDSYTIYVTSVSNDKNSSRSSQSVIAIPSEVILTEGEPTVTTVEANWEKPDGIVDEWTVACTPSEYAEAIDDTVVPVDMSVDYSGVCNVTRPGDLFTITVTSQRPTDKTASSSKELRAVPESVAELTVGKVTTSMVELMWTMKPICESNCVWTSFSVDYNGSMPSSISNNSRSTTITSLIPGETYDFTIIVISFQKSSAPTTVGQRTIPESVKTLSVEYYNSVSVTLLWEIKDNCAYEGCVWSGYTVKYTRAEEPESEVYVPGKNDTSINITSLMPGSLYNFLIYVVSEDEQSSEETASQRLRPASVTSANSTIRQNSITVTWEKPRGTVTAYQTNITDTITGNNSSELVKTLEVEFDELIAFRNYNVTICSKSVAEECEDILELNIQTLPDMPSAPQDLVLRSENITTVRVAFRTPALPNGIIDEYKISYNGKRGELRDDDNSITVPAEDDDDYSVLIQDLLPGFQYEFMVVAVNQGGDGEPATDTITLGQEKPPTPSSTESPVANKPVRAVKSFTVEFSPTVFSHCNGEINNYTVIVVESGAYDSEADKPISAEGSPPPTKTFNEVSSKKPLGEYQAFAPKPYPYPWSIEDCQAGSSRRRRQTTMLEVIVIGDGSSSEGYTNGELHSKRKYRVKFRIMNEVGYADSIYSAEIKTKLHPAAWLVPLLFGLFLILLILIILIILKERREPGSVRRRMPWTNGGMDNHGFREDEKMKPMRRTGDKRPVKLANFGVHLEEMEKDSDYLFSEEYNDLRPVGKNQADDTAKLDCNKSKNRFSNILPYDHTRVKLSPAEDEPGSDYINANYMVGSKSSREYIACQGPLQNTEEDMWRMVWEQGASLIVMVTQLMEGNKIKCHQYWCQEGEGPVRYGDIIVKNIATEQNDLWVVRKFSLTKGPVTREVLHFNFTAWPDHGVPESADHLIKFVQAVRRVKKTDGKPIVVHCSAGVGRTGTFIALDTLMSQMESSDEVDIFGLIRSMRMNRCLMVQTEIQYVYIHQCIMALLEGDDENTYENYNGTTDPYYNEALI
ncbi:receptor-type tyrosine-protein phosphatase H-like isoform X3 [Apostichopus japonicus]|uniref:receptor-type tyrosine-protein phosphatase H-like isoform X3 n=1 Tax=Stichopus japonicus TaxID=307972 RepID=UPI003AB38779